VIVTRLMGGLGNQMFQYAHGRALALQHGGELVLDLSWFSRQAPGDTPRTYALDDWRLPPEVGVSLQPPRALSGWRHRALATVGSRSLRLVREATPGYDPSAARVGDDVLLVGYWQSERYFDCIRDRLLAELVPAAPADPNNAQLLATVEEGASVALHVRRGDYLANPRAAAFHGLLDAPYYDTAIRHVRERVEAPRFVIFSDDPQWCRAHLDVGRSATFVDHNAGPRAYWDLHVMSRCTHAIIANSSFSWWGAWLNSNPDKLVIAPRVWFRDPVAAAAAIVPDSWLRLDC
jgi:hypothetical protein